MEKPEINEIKKRKREKRIIVITLILLIVATVVQVYYAKITFNNTPLPSNIVVFSLLNINIILLLLLIFLIFRNLVKIFLSKEQRKSKKLSRKLVISFFLFTSIPLILQFIISSLIIKSTISGWFNKKVEDNLKASLRIAESYYDEKRNEALRDAIKLYTQFKINRNKVDKVAKEFYLTGYIIGIKDKPLITKYAKHETKYFAPNIEKIIAFVVNSPSKQGTDIIQIKKKEIIYGFYKGNKYFSIAMILTKRSITKSAKTISQNYAEFSYLNLMKNPIEKTYLLSLLIVTMVIILSATWFGFHIAKDITTPINKLVKATQEIGSGNLEYSIDIKSQDEIRILIESFKKMVEELKSSRKKLIERQQYIESIINNVNSGVISISKMGIINTINPFVEKLLNVKVSNIQGIHYKNIDNATLKCLLTDIIEEFKLLNKSVIYKNTNINLKNDFLILSIFATILKQDEEILGYLIVISDMTQVTFAQRAAAWREVAQRVAHEIKNPLTPIQLSAQRLRRKFAENLSCNKDEFIKSVNNILQYVDLIRTLVNEFSKFAKLPEIKVESHNLNDILKEIIPSFKPNVKDITFELKLDSSIPDIHLDKKQIYQVIINLLTNAVQSYKNIERKNKKIVLETKYLKRSKKVILRIKDNGSGIEDSVKQRVFEPYFSTKKGGTGIGLTIVKSIIESHNGEIKIKDNKPNGTIFEINLKIT